MQEWPPALKLQQQIAIASGRFLGEFCSTGSAKVRFRGIEGTALDAEIPGRFPGRSGCRGGSLERCRGSRRFNCRRGIDGLANLLFEPLSRFFRPLAELADPFSQAATYLRQPAGSKDQERYHDDEDNVNGLNCEWHANLLFGIVFSSPSCSSQPTISWEALDAFKRLASILAATRTLPS